MEFYSLANIFVLIYSNNDRWWGGIEGGNLSWNGLTRDLMQGFFLGVELFRTAASCKGMLGVGTYS